MNILQLKAHIEELSEEAIEEWLKENPPEKIKEEIKKTLNQARSKIVFTALGFEIVDRNNIYMRHPWKDKDGNYPYATEVLMDITKNTVREFMEKNVKDLLPGLESGAKRSIAETFARDFKEEVRRQANTEARAMASQAKKVVFELINEELDLPRAK